MGRVTASEKISDNSYHLLEVKLCKITARTIHNLEQFGSWMKVKMYFQVLAKKKPGRKLLHKRALQASMGWLIGFKGGGGAGNQ